MHPSDPGGVGDRRHYRAMPETALYPTVKGFLEAAGFAVKGEVCGCDIVAVGNRAPSRLAIVEMRRTKCGSPCRRHAADVTAIPGCGGFAGCSVLG
jgi:hypothetical protein